MQDVPVRLSPHLRNKALSEDPNRTDENWQRENISSSTKLEEVNKLSPHVVEIWYSIG